MDYLLPSTVYQPPPRPGRRQLNTIAEDNEETSHGVMSDSEGSFSDRTIIAKPITLSAKTYTPASQQRTLKPIITFTKGPPSAVSSECDEEEYPQSAARSSYAGSDAGTVFSETCPSLTGSHVSDATSFVTESSRLSVSTRGRLSLLIPRGSWQGFEGGAKHMTFGMSPSTKVRLSPENLERLPKHIPSVNAPPSFGDASSTRSESPVLRGISAPPTPDVHNLEIIEGQSWGGQTHDLTLNTPLEIAIDEDESILYSAEEAHSATSTNYNDIMRQFPFVPGKTPMENTPITPSIPRAAAFEALTGEAGVQLPEQALEMLQNLSKQRYAESIAEGSVSGQEEAEMKECPVSSSRPRSFVGGSPDSEYSISALSIPSPGGFFASLKTGDGNNWCMPSRKASPPPSSSTAENFYNAPWNRPASVKETIIEYSDCNQTDGPPTVRQAMFDLGISGPKEDEDMYGGSEQPANVYEDGEWYEDGLKRAAEVNMDRTSSWLAAQTTYLSALRETNPLNDPADFPITPVVGPEDLERKNSIESEINQAAKFIEEAKAATSPAAESGAGSDTTSPVKETMFLQAFTYQKAETKRSDVFLHASSRLDSVQSTRIATPKRHVQSLLNNHTSKTLEPEHARPKYRGPFNQNPRNTKDLTSDAEQAELSTLERQRTALNAIKPSLWSLEAQRTILYNGRLMANKAASERLTKKDADATESEEPQKPNKKRPRVLDLAGAAIASWAWAAASKWSNAKVYTVQTKKQAELARNCSGDDVESFRPDTPKNHKVLSVPHLWQLPFRDNYFDLISARTLHMYLRAKPVPGVESIDEWDLTLRECMRVLKPGGILDFFVMDSGISNGSSNLAVNLSPSNMTSSNTLPSTTSTKRSDIAAEFKYELEHRGYDVDGGCGRLMGRLKQQGFVGVKRQWIGLPLGCLESETAAMKTHHRNTSTSSVFNQHQSSSTPRRPSFLPPRPNSAVSEISKIYDQYSGAEAVQRTVGSTNDVADMSALLGELLWEEWLVRLRIESGKFNPDQLLDGIEEQFGEWRRSGKAAWRGVIGWARKPSKKEVVATEFASVPSFPSPVQTANQHFGHGFAIETPLPSATLLPPTSYSAPAGIQRRASIRASRVAAPSSAGRGLTLNTRLNARGTSRRSGTNDWSRRVNEISAEDFTMSAVDRGDVGEIPMMILG